MPYLEALASRDELNEVLKTRVEKACALLDESLELYPNDFRKDSEIKDILDKYDGQDGEALEKLNETFAVAGRIKGWRSFGKVTFFHLQDQAGSIQVFVARDDLGADAYRLFKKSDIGDVVGVKGTLFRTKTGELTLKARTFELLTKSMRPLPEKYHGLKDVETPVPPALRGPHRHRPHPGHLPQAHAHRGRPCGASWTSAAFWMVETPMLQPIPGGATAKPFTTHHNALDMRLVHAHRPGTLPQAAAGGRVREGLRDQPQLPQRGHLHPAQPRVHHARVLLGLRGLP